MAFQTGKVANPGGRPKAKPWTEALKLVANETVDDKDGAQKKRLRKLAEKTFEEAMNGDIQAIKEIGNRLEGTPVQSVDIEHDVGDSLSSLLTKLSGKTRGIPGDGE